MFCDSMMLGGGRKAAFTIENSVLLNGVNQYFTRTPSTPGNRKTWTFSAWVKLNAEASQMLLFSGTSANYTQVFVQDTESVWVYSYSGGTTLSVSTANVFRDYSAWYHVCVSVDTTEDAADERVKVYINGVLQGVMISTQVERNVETQINNVETHSIAQNFTPTNFNGYMAQPILVDGHVLAPTAFGETDPVTGSWRPKKPQISEYGTNGFVLDFATPADLGRDVSGKANHWNPVSLGAGNVFSDTPTNNFATLNALTYTGAPYITNTGNLTLAANSNPSLSLLPATLGMTQGKWYFEAKPSNVSAFSTQHTIGLIKAGAGTGNYVGSDAYGWGYRPDAQRFNSGAGVSYGVATTMGTDVVQVCFDADNGRLFFGKNGTWMNSAVPEAGTGAAYTGLTNGPYFFAVGSQHTGTGSAVWSTNFGQRPFAYTPPTGFKALCTANLPTPSIQSPAKFMDVVTYTGTGAARSVGGLGFQPDLVWIKNRSLSTDHRLYDSVRGAGRQLYSNAASQENTSSAGLNGFLPDGFSLPTPASDTAENANGNSYVAWCWKAGNAAVNNTAGSITSQVSANQTAGFSIVTYTGAGSTGTVGHGLGASPALILLRARSNATDWWVSHKSLTLQSDKYLILNQSVAVQTSAGWLPTSASSITVSGGQNNNGWTYVAYCWSEIDGFSKFGSYTGNGSADGPFVYCGFRPRFVLIKRTDSAGTAWLIHDTARDRGNPTLTNLNANDSSTDNATMPMDVTANGFKIRDSYAGWNGSGGTYIFAAFAEAPLGGIKTAPAKAR